MNELEKLGLGYVHDTSEKLTKEETLGMFKDFLFQEIITVREAEYSDTYLHLVKGCIGNLHHEDFDFELLFENIIRHLKGE